MNSLYRRGLDGRGVTIAIIDSFGSPLIRSDLRRFDQAFHLRPPPHFRIIRPAGRVTPVRTYSGDRLVWLEETSMDVEYAHAMAPGANILLVETPTDETVGMAGFPQIVRAENFVIRHRLAQVMSLSFGAAEQTFPSEKSLLSLRQPLVDARRARVTVVAASGDNGATSPSTMSPSYFDHRVVAWPASDPLVTAVGGTQLHLGARGGRIAQDTVWNETKIRHEPRASGGGLSSIFLRPAYQRTVATTVGRHRGIPDISMTAARNGGALVYVTIPHRACCGFLDLGGTSLGTPMFAGIVAIADQATGHPLGLLNPALYQLSSGSPAIPDITRGDNSVTFHQNGMMIKVNGYDAKRGFDLATGLGTINGAKLVEALASG